MRIFLVAALVGLVIMAIIKSRPVIEKPEVAVKNPAIKVVKKPAIKEVIIEKPVVAKKIIEKPAKKPRPANPYLEGWNDEATGRRRNHEMCQYYDDCVAYEQGQSDYRRGVCKLRKYGW